MNIETYTIEGARFVCELPAGFDERTRITIYDEPSIGEKDVIIIAHPDREPMKFNREKLKFEAIKP